ncbi:MAG: hypothetical protein KDI48_15860 [Xanthomonadales bacterium]|nr:hypothetical protein [Xanthomonadales bacterium]
MARSLLPISTLDGCQITRWHGTEMAHTEHPLRWQHPDVPYLQCISIELALESAAPLQLIAHLPDHSGFHGLYLRPAPAAMAAAPNCSPGSIFRSRTLAELPLGAARLVQLRRDGPDAVIEISLQIGRDRVSLLAGEVAKGIGNTVRIVEPDESILVQVNGKRPPTPCRARVEG